VCMKKEDLLYEYDIETTEKCKRCRRLLHSTCLN
jgi:hypothetical protein